MASINEWGNITWYLFHGIAEKIKEEKFTQNKLLIFKIISSVCSNLPCPSCSEHAVSYLKTVNINNINTKDDLKKFLFNFHNLKNKSLNKKEFTVEEFNEKYKTIIMPIIFQKFFKVYSINNRSEKMMMYTSFKNIFLLTLKKDIFKLQNDLDH